MDYKEIKKQFLLRQKKIDRTKTATIIAQAIIKTKGVTNDSQKNK